MQKLLLTAKEVVQVTGLSRTTVYNLINPEAGIIPAIRIGKSIRVPVVGLRAWVASLCNVSLTDVPTVSEDLRSWIAGQLDEGSYE